MNIRGELDNRDDIALAHDQVFQAVDGDLGCGVFAVHDLVSDLYFDRNQFAVVTLAARADGNDLDRKSVV